MAKKGGEEKIQYVPRENPAQYLEYGKMRTMPRRKIPKWKPLVDESMPEEYRQNARQLQNRLAEIGFANPFDACEQDAEGNIKLKPINQIPAGTKNLIREIINTPNGPIIKFHNPLPALNTLAKTLGMQAKRIEIVEQKKIEEKEDEELQRLIDEHNKKNRTRKIQERNNRSRHRGRHRTRRCLIPHKTPNMTSDT